MCSSEQEGNTLFMNIPKLDQVREMSEEELKSLGGEVLEDLHMHILNQFESANMRKRIELERLIEKVELAMRSAVFTKSVSNRNNVNVLNTPSPKAEKIYQEGLKSNNFNKIKKSAYMGLPEAINKLGFLYESGHGVDKDLGKAYRFYKLAADKGHAEAIKNLAYCYQKGCGTEKDINTAIELYKLASSKGIAEADYRVGMIYMRGRDIKQDYRTAFGYFNKAGNKGYNKAYIIMGDMYRLGRGFRKDFSLALENYNNALTEARYVKDKELEKVALRKIRKLENIPTTWFMK